MGYPEPGPTKALILGFVHNILASPFYQRYARSLHLAGDEQVLDFGCGSGALARHIAGYLAGGGGHLTCLDPCATWMVRVKRALRRFPNVSFLLGDILSVEIDDGSFDVIVVHFVLHDIDRELRPETVKALSRTLRDTGRLFIREPTRGGNAMPAEEIRQLMGQAGLRELTFAEANPPFMRPMYAGVFGRAP